LEPQGPAAIAANPQTSDVFVLDTVNSRIVQVLPLIEDGKALPHATLTSNEPEENVEHAADLVFAHDAFYVLDAQGRKVVKYDTEGEWKESFEIKNPAIRLGGTATLVVLANDDIRIREAGVKELPIDPSAARGPGSDETALSMTTEAGVLSSKTAWGEDGSSVKLALKSAGNGAGKAVAQMIDVRSKEALASVELIGTDGQGRFYVLATELGEGEKIHTVLARYSAGGELMDAADIRVEDTVFLPRRFVALDNKGTAYFLQPLSSEVLIVELAFRPRADLSAPTHVPYQPRGRETTLVVDEDFLVAVEEASEDEPYEASRGKITRDQVLKNAYAFLDLEWTMSRANYGRGSTCRSPKNWRRPARLNGKVGKKIRSAPYSWGSSMSVSSIEKKLAAGRVAGDICTCRKKSRGYCITPRTVGVDCSGFVSQCLQEKYHTTSGMPAITTRLSGLRSLKRGDILNRKGRHVRLVAEDAPKSGPLVIKTIESSVSCGGVCEAVYSAVQLAKYKPRRYKFIKEVSEAPPRESSPEAPKKTSQLQIEVPAVANAIEELRRWLGL
jgi:hypothetical protein